MAAPRKKIMALDVESALALMQEIYNDIVEQKNTASLITKKMLTFMKDAEDMSTIGPVIKDQQKILNLCTDRKLGLLKMQGVLMKQTTASGGESGGFSKLTLTDEDRAMLEKLMAEDEITNQKYNING